MARLIDKMTDREVHDTVLNYMCGIGYGVHNPTGLRQKLEKLFAKELQWFDKLEPDDEQTWVLCFVSDYAPEGRMCTAWIHDKDDYGYMVASGPGGCWKYATPIDLNVRYKRGEEL